ncbi:GMC family oxidoreductase [Paraburkholderia jirisanensis]
MRRGYDFVVCGAGTSGSVVARRLAENPATTVLVLEAGGADDAPEVTEAANWFANLGSERDWSFVARSNPHVNGRSIPMSMGKVLGGGSSINAMHWARGHRSDWDYFASEAGDPDWSYMSLLETFRQIEDWHGEPDTRYRGVGGMVHVGPSAPISPIAQAWLKGSEEHGIPVFESQNGKIVEAPEGASIGDVCVKDGRRVSVFRSYLYPIMDRPNVTVLTGAMVTRIIFNGKRATGVEYLIDGKHHVVEASHEVVLSLGAIHTPKVLMQSGVGDQAALREFSIPVVQHLRGVGRNLQDHLMVAGCIWEYPDSMNPAHEGGVQANGFLRSDPSLSSPDIQLIQTGMPIPSREIAAQFAIPHTGWTLLPVLVRPESRGRVRLTGAGPADPVVIEANALSASADLAALTRAIERIQEIGRSAVLRPFIKRQVTPGRLEGAALENFVRDSVMSVWHQTCTAKMGNDADSVVDGKLAVHGLNSLTIADGSVLPRITTGNTMAPCVVVGERAASLLQARHNL